MTVSLALRLLRRSPALAWFSLWLMGQVVKESLRLAHDTMTPGLTMEPRIVKIPLHVENDLELTLLASCITITPGTLVVGVAPATETMPPALFVHYLFGADHDQVVAELEALETRLLGALRGGSGHDALVAESVALAAMAESVALAAVDEKEDAS